MNSSSDIILAAINAKWIHPCLALRLLKANLGNLEERCTILEFALRQPLKEKVEPILRSRPRILGLSVSIWNHLAALELLEALESGWAAGVHNAENGAEPFERPTVVLGGPEVSYIAANAEIFKYADYVIRGEGESAFRELCVVILNQPQNKAVNGEAAAENIPLKTEAADRRIFSGSPVFIEGKQADLCAIDPGYRLYSDEDLQSKLVYVEASRGCPFGCEFCLSSLDRKVRYFQLEPFLANIDSLIKRGARTFKFLDRSFNLDIGRAIQILEFFLDRLGRGLFGRGLFGRGLFGRGCQQEPCYSTSPPFCVHFEMVPANFPPELRAALACFPAGSLRIEVGIQTLNPVASALIDRPCHPEKELEALTFLRSNTRAIVHADLIAGLPGEGMASFAAGFDRLWEAVSPNADRPGQARDLPESHSQTESHGRAEIQLGFLKRLPGTSIARHSEEYGMVYNEEPPYEVIETASLSRRELADLKNFARFWETIMNRGISQEITARLFPAGKPVFSRFLALASRLALRFGRAWGIDRKALIEALEEETG